MQKLKELYRRALEVSERLRTSDKALILITVAIVVPVVYFYFIYPAQQSYVKRAKTSCTNARTRFDRLKAEEDAAEANRAEMQSRQEELSAINSLVVGTDAAIQLINSISNYAAKNSLDVKFLRKQAQFDRVYEKAFTPRDGNGLPDEQSRFTYKLLPVEISFKSKSSNFLALLNYIESFKKLNYTIRKLTASRSEDGRVDVSVTFEIIVELKFASGGNS